MIKINKSLLAQMKTQAGIAYPNEACGLLTMSGRKTSLFVCSNASETPDKNFVIKPCDFASAEDQGEVIAVWHSHVDEPATPSEFDKHACNASGLHWYILNIYKKEDDFEFGDIVHLAPSGEEMDYVGRPYIYGVYDCFTIAVDYYRKEFGIDLDYRAPGYPEMSDWHLKGVDLLTNSYEKAGFVDITGRNAVVGDLFLIQVGSPVPNHVAIYLGDNMILHHTEGRLSHRDIYGGGYWQKHTTAQLRHRSKI